MNLKNIVVLLRVSGGELFDYVLAKECLGETEAASFIQQILLAIKHLHDNHIVHLDIKVNIRLTFVSSTFSYATIPSTIARELTVANQYSQRM